MCEIIKKVCDLFCFKGLVGEMRLLIVEDVR